ncbi:MAG: response regulator transcription factor [Acidobacteria bacterium]|nr:response regulator transcription factor [Acidobacteriota bacterium]
MTSNLRIFLVDDHPVFLEGLSIILKQQTGWQVVGQAGDGQEALDLLKDTPTDIVLMDLSMPTLGGAQATLKIKRAFPSVRIIILSRHCELSSLNQLMQAGASGYVSKTSGSKALVDAIRKVSSGGFYVEPSLAEQLVGQLFTRQTATPDEITAKLSERETEVLRLTARGYGNKEIAEQLLLSVKTIEHYKARAQEKLGFQNKSDIVRYAFHQGWLEDS